MVLTFLVGTNVQADLRVYILVNGLVFSKNIFFLKAFIPNHATEPHLLSMSQHSSTTEPPHLLSMSQHSSMHPMFHYISSRNKLKYILYILYIYHLLISHHIFCDERLNQNSLLKILVFSQSLIAFRIVFIKNIFRINFFRFSIVVAVSLNNQFQIINMSSVCDVFFSFCCGLVWFGMVWNGLEWGSGLGSNCQFQGERTSCRINRKTIWGAGTVGSPATACAIPRNFRS